MTLKFFTTSLLILLSSFSVIAADEAVSENVSEALVDLDLPPLSNKSRQFGYSPFPVVQCPAVNTKYSSLLSDLRGLKDKLKAEGCSAEKNELASFEEILGKGRKKFVDLVKKGMNEELEKAEIDSVKAYVDKVVRKTAKVSGLVNNAACFDEDSSQKQTLLSIMAKTINSTTSILGKLSGPWGLKLKLGGQFTAGLLKSIDRVVKENKAYNFGDFSTLIRNYRFKTEKDYRETRLAGHKDRILYVTSLCAYYKLKEELDEYSDPWAAKELYEDFKESANKQLDFYKSQCSDCAEIISDYRGKKANNMTFQDPVNSESVINYKQLFRRMSWQELKKMYQNQVNRADLAFDVGKGKGIGHKTIRSLTTLMWSELQLERIAKATEDESADQALDAVVFTQEQIEDFLVDQEAANFIENRYEAAEFHFDYLKYYTSNSFSKWDQYLSEAFRRVRGPYDFRKALFGQTDPSVTDSSVRKIHWAYGKVDFAEVVTKALKEHQAVDQRSLRKAEHFRKEFKKGLRKRVGHIYRAYSSGKKFCRFFLNGYFGSGRRNTIADECEQGDLYSQNIRDYMKMLEKTSMATRQGDLIGRFNAGDTIIVTDANGKKEEVELKYTRNWVESLSGYIVWSIGRPLKEKVAPVVVNPELESDFSEN